MIRDTAMVWRMIDALSLWHSGFIGAASAFPLECEDDGAATAPQLPQICKALHTCLSRSYYCRLAAVSLVVLIWSWPREGPATKYSTDTE